MDPYTHTHTHTHTHIHTHTHTHTYTHIKNKCTWTHLAQCVSIHNYLARTHTHSHMSWIHMQYNVTYILFVYAFQHGMDTHIHTRSLASLGRVVGELDSNHHTETTGHNRNLNIIDWEAATTAQFPALFSYNGIFMHTHQYSFSGRIYHIQHGEYIYMA